MVNGNIEGVVFCNTSNIEEIMPELQNVCLFNKNSSWPITLIHCFVYIGPSCWM